jgi:SAM-dependent methyltransferase
MSNETPTPRELYDASATGWARQGPLSLSDYTGRPPTLALCEPLAGTRVLDLGCGEGYCARLLRKKGAREVVGIDVSAQMIALARAEEEREPLGIRYEVGEATALSGCAEGSFDVVLSMFMFNYLGIDDTRKALAEILRVLRPGGRLVLAVPHPSFPLLRPPEPPFYFDLGGAGYFSARDQRHSGRIWKRDGTALDVQVCHKTIEDYFEALAAAGFTRMPIVRELRVTPEILAADPPFFGPLLDVPLHMAIAVRKS